MKRLVIAAGLALIAHGLLFSVDARWLKPGMDARVLPPRPITISLTPIPGPAPEAIWSPDRKDEESKETVFPVKLPEIEKLSEKPSSIPEKRVQESVRKPKPSPQFFPLAAPAQEKISVALQDTKDSNKDTPPANPTSASPVSSFPAASSLPLRQAVPVYKQNPRPEYPSVARRRGYEGTVILEVLVDEKGKVGDLRVLQSSGYEVLDRAALTSVREWLFEPGVRGDEKIAMWVNVPIRFKID